MTNFNDIKAFGSKTAADLFQEIYNSTKKKEKIITDTIYDLKKYINNIGDAVQLGSIIANYMDVLVKSDEHLIKMTSIITRAVARGEDGGDTTLTEEEKKQLRDIWSDMGESHKSN